mmetsp:Transcript_5997/g.23712  ORF Transcript_5997/g.23712 Transcript_5997/m.23712 type:complete len:223 (+) Transcript_5997:553-1221(+)
MSSTALRVVPRRTRPRWPAEARRRRGRRLTVGWPARRRQAAGAYPRSSLPRPRAPGAKRRRTRTRGAWLRRLQLRQTRVGGRASRGHAARRMQYRAPPSFDRGAAREAPAAPTPTPGTSSQAAASAAAQVRGAPLARWGRPGALLIPPAMATSTAGAKYRRAPTMAAREPAPLTAAPMPPPGWTPIAIPRLAASCANTAIAEATKTACCCAMAAIPAITCIA